jgi:Cu/Ag efflux protein CusF
MHRYFLRVLPLLLIAGCSNESSAPRYYSLKGTVQEVDPDKKTIRIAHEDIPGFMRAMTMTFEVEDAKLLSGMEKNDTVEGKLKNESNKTVVTELHKTGKPTSENKENAEIKANLAKLSPEDRKLAEEQKECPTGGPLGSMGVPIKLMIKGQPVFICCEHCKEITEKDPDATLKKVAEMKKDKQTAP